jgi:hypothetical protein
MNQFSKYSTSVSTGYKLDTAYCKSFAITAITAYPQSKRQMAEVTSLKTCVSHPAPFYAVEHKKNK